MFFCKNKKYNRVGKQTTDFSICGRHLIFEQCCQIYDHCQKKYLKISSFNTIVVSTD